jgi:amino-acid N-acetyltransferase
MAAISDNSESKYLIRRTQPADLPWVQQLLHAAVLPREGVALHFARFLVAEDRSSSRPLGVAGLELYGACALLRSVAVDVGARSAGLGSALTRAALAEACAHGVDALYLLTTSAEQFFVKHGFARTERSRVPASVTGSIEFTSVCPDSAIVMQRSLRAR